MSQSNKLDMADPWVRLQYVYENCKVKQYTAGHYGKYENGKLSMCGIGWALHSAGWSDDDLKPTMSCLLKSFTNVKEPTKALEEYGFSKEERRKTRSCPVIDCSTTGSLQRVLEHLNEYHQYPIPNIGKLIPWIRTSTKKPSNSEKIADLLHDLKSLV